MMLIVSNSTTALLILEIRSSSPISDTARPNSRFMKTNAMLTRKRTKKVFEIKLASGLSKLSETSRIREQDVKDDTEREEDSSKAGKEC